jgi:phosphomannomutase
LQKYIDGGVEIIASHNPIDYSGMTFVARGPKPMSGDSARETFKESWKAKTSRHLLKLAY